MLSMALIPMPPCTLRHPTVLQARRVVYAKGSKQLFQNLPASLLSYSASSNHTLSHYHSCLGAMTDAWNTFPLSIPLLN